MFAPQLEDLGNTDGILQPIAEDALSKLGAFLDTCGESRKFFHA